MICDGVLRKLSNSATQRGNFKTPTIMLYNAMFRMTWFIIAKLRGVGVAHLFILFFFVLSYHASVHSQFRVGGSGGSMS